jgi:hypothetical protein
MALTAAVLSGCGGGHATNPDERSHDGPLVIGEPHWWWHEARQGDVFSDGLEILRIHGSELATIDAVTSHGGDNAMTFLGARLGLPGRPDDFNQLMPGFPPVAVPKRYQTDAVGARLEPGKGYMLILGYRVDDEDALDQRTSVTVDYTIGDTQFSADIPAGIYSCPPPLTDSNCDSAY